MTLIIQLKYHSILGISLEKGMITFCSLHMYLHDNLAILFTAFQLIINYTFCTSLVQINDKRTISSKINVTSKGVRLSEILQHSVMKFDRSNKFEKCYGQVNSLRLKSSVASKCATKYF